MLYREVESKIREHSASLEQIGQQKATKQEVATVDGKTIGIQQQINNLVINGTGNSNPEVIQARGSYKVLNDRLDNMMNLLPSRNLFNKTTIFQNKEVDRATGNLIDNAQFSVSDFISVTNGKTLYFSLDGSIASDSKIHGIYKYTQGNNIPTYYQLVTVNGSTEGNKGFYAVESGVTSIRVLFRKDLQNKIQVEYDQVTPYDEHVKLQIPKSISIQKIDDKIVSPETTTFIDKITSVNLFDNTKVKKDIELNTSTGIEQSNTNNFGVSDFIETTKGKTLYFSYDGVIVNNADVVYRIYRYDSNKVYKSNFELVVNTNGVITNKGLWLVDSEYIRLLVRPRMMDKLQVEYDQVTPYVKYVNGYFLNESINVKAKESYNVLYGKKFHVDGDSITAGLAIDVDSTHGIKLTYAGLTAIRNNMIYTNTAVSGSTIHANIDDPQYMTHNPFWRTERYKRVAQDTDYLTLFFGWNDCFFGKLGTINDTDDTTIYGAYKLVLEYYLLNYPKMKIGVIIPYLDNNARDNIGNYPFVQDPIKVRNAIKEVCKKYGVAYLDLEGENVPCLYDRETPIPTAIKQKHMQTFFADTVHPNLEGYKFLATIYENFLRSL